MHATKTVRGNLHINHVISLDLSCCFTEKKTFVVTCFWAKVCWSSGTSTKVYSCVGDTSSDLEGHGPKSPPPPCVGVAKIFDWGEAKPKMTCNDVIRNF